MPTYIQFLTLTSRGREKMSEDPQAVLSAQAAAAVPGVTVLGLYGVLGEYDFVNIVDAPDNGAAARFSLELGVRAHARVVTMPAIPISRLEGASESEPPGLEVEEALQTPEGRQGVDDVYA